MTTQNLTPDTFAPTISQNGIVLVDWWASWCGPCRAFSPIYEKAAERNPDVTFGKVDTQAHPELGATFSIRSIPTLMVFRDGILLYNQAGMLPARALDELIAQARQLDMTEVRERIAREERRTKPAKQASA